jgi:malonyl-CoA O-methyltransferase
MSAVFELDKTKVRQAFTGAAKTYDQLAVLQRAVGNHLLQQFAITQLAGTVLDLGCGTGFLTGKLQNLPGYERIVAVDISMPMLHRTREKCISNGQLSFLCADIECLPVMQSGVDWFCSNLALQWCQNAQAVFNGIRRILKPEGRLIFSTFGPETLNELKAAWAAVDEYTHVNHFYSEQELLEFIGEAGLHDIQINTRQYISQYPCVMTLMRELKGIGAHNVNHGRNRGMTGKAALQQMVANYEAMSAQDLVPATFEVIYVSARASS